ncbi:MAG: hypothetical protein IJH32_09280 [Ruminococcus sp.]|nr:hypothetical protein [Ruminococcus sp.]
MRKYGMLLTMIAAVLLVALCMGALELSKQVLPDYQNTVEVISLSENQSILTVNNREATSLYPWDIYESAKENSQIKPVVSYDFDTVFPDKYFAQMISIFSPWIMNGYDSVDWQQHMEYINDGNNFIFFIKDVKFSDGNGENYLVNIALTEERLLYYSCDRITTEAIQSSAVSFAYNRLNTSYSVFREVYKGGNYSNGSDDAESDGGNTSSDLFSGDDNCLIVFIQKVIAFEYSEIEWKGLDPALVDSDGSKYSNQMASAISESNTAGMIYRHSDDTPNVVNVEFSQGDVDLVLFYDLEMCSITGFSLKI